MVWFFKLFFFLGLISFQFFCSLLLRAIQVAQEGLYGGQSPASIMTCRSLSFGVALASFLF